MSKTRAANPAIIGTHWFQFIDQPNTGRMDGENYNIGMVDITDRPYPEMVAAMKETNSCLLDVRLGKLPPVAPRLGVEAQTVLPEKKRARVAPNACKKNSRSRSKLRAFNQITSVSISCRPLHLRRSHERKASGCASTRSRSWLQPK